MPQGLTTAPVNHAPPWPAGHVAALREVGAKEKNIAYCLGWVRRFFAAHGGRGGTWGADGRLAWREARG